MNSWTQLSIEYANQRSYLDDLFQVYPTIPEGIRSIDDVSWKEVEKAFGNHDNVALIKNLFKFNLFPIKDSYVAYLKRDRDSIKRNPATAARLAGRLYEMGLNVIYARCSEPKETNRQIGPLFRRWINKGSLGVKLLKIEDFIKTKENAILDSGDAAMMFFATVKIKGVKAEKIIVLDGYLCSLNYSKMYEEFSEAYKYYNTMSVLVLRNFLYQL